MTPLTYFRKSKQFSLQSETKSLSSLATSIRQRWPFRENRKNAVVSWNELTAFCIPPPKLLPTMSRPGYRGMSTQTRNILYPTTVLFSNDVVKKKAVFIYIAQYPVRWTAQSALHFLPPLANLFIPTPTRLLREAF